MVRKKSAAVMGVIVTTALIVAACSSSSKSSGGSGTGASTGADTPIPVAEIGTFSGPQAASQAGEKSVAQAWASWVNAHGGINGHQVKLYVADDAGNAATSLAVTKNVIANDHVVAIIDGSNFDAVWGPAAAQAGVPVLGGNSFDLSFLTNPDFFPAGANAVAVNYGLMSNAKSHGTKFAYLYCAASPICAQNAPIFKQIATQLDMTVDISQSVPEASADYTPQCTTLKESGVSSYSFIDASNFVLKLVETCAAQGLKAPLVTLGGTLTPDWLKSSATDGILSAEGNFPFVDDSNAATQEFQAAIKQYAPNIGALMGSTSANQWVGGKLLEAAVKASPSGSVTAASIKTGLYSLKDETLGGLAPPLNFTKGQTARINCYFTLGISNGKFVEPNGLKTSCAPDSLVDSIITSVGIK